MANCSLVLFCPSVRALGAVLVGLGFEGGSNNFDSNALVYSGSSDASKLTTHMVWYILFILFATYAMLPLPLLWSVAAASVTVIAHFTSFLTIHAVGSRHNQSPWEVSRQTVLLHVEAVITTLGDVLLCRRI